jgi:hypothetical protein
VALVAEGEVDEGFFFELVGFGGAGGWAGRGGALDGQERTVSGEALQQRLDVEEGAHVGGLFLDPDDFGGAGVLIQRGLQLGFGPGVELVEEDDGDRVVSSLGSFDTEIVADFAGADEDAARVGDLVVGDDVEEMVASEVGDRAHGVGMAEH